MVTDLNYSIANFGQALMKNKKLEGLSIKENKIKQSQYFEFWDFMHSNKTLRKMNATKTDITDKVCTKISSYLKLQDIRLQDLNLSRNQIGTDGLIALADALKINRSITALNIAQN